jgi:hypothetical protein
MQNEPNLRGFWAVSGDCEEKQTQNKPNSKPIKANSKPKQTQSNPISDYPCVSKFAGYNLVFHNSNGRNFDGDYLKWQMYRRQMQ